MVRHGRGHYSASLETHSVIVGSLLRRHMRSPDAACKLQDMGEHKAVRCLKCVQDTSSMGMVEEESEVWIPSSEEYEVIHILSNLDDYLIPIERKEAVIKKVENMDTVNPLRRGPYSELRSSRNIPRISSPRWPPKLTKLIAKRTIRGSPNPYAGAVGDGKMYVSQLTKCTPLPTPSTTSEGAENAISLEDHQGWERLDFDVDGAISTAHGLSEGYQNV